MRKRKSNPGISFDDVSEDVVVEIYDKAYRDFNRMEREAERHYFFQSLKEDFVEFTPMIVIFVVDLAGTIALLLVAIIFFKKLLGALVGC